MLKIQHKIVGFFLILILITIMAIPTIAAEENITGIPLKLDMRVGESVNWTVKPDDGNWSGYGDVLEIKQTGLISTIKAVKEGSITLTYTTKAGKSAETTVTIKPSLKSSSDSNLSGESKNTSSLSPSSNNPSASSAQNSVVANPAAGKEQLFPVMLLIVLGLSFTVSGLFQRSVKKGKAR